MTRASLLGKSNFQMNLSGEQERHERKETVMGRASLHCPGEARRGTLGAVAIVSAQRVTNQEKR